MKKEKFVGTKIEYELRQHPGCPDEIIPKLEKCFSTIRRVISSRHYEFIYDDEQIEREGLEINVDIGIDNFINTCCQILKYNIRIFQLYSAEMNTSLDELCEYLSGKDLSSEQVDIINDLKETYYNNFIIKMSDFKTLYERQKIVENLERICTKDR